MGIIFAKQPDPLPRDSFGPRLRDLRVRCGITMGELARVLGVPVPLISKLELGDIEIPEHTTWLKRGGR